MISILCPPLVFQGVGFGGLPLPFGKLFSYEAGTSTPQATWTDSTGVQQNANPIILNANGQAPVWLDPSLTYKFRLTDAFNNQIYITDQVQGALTASALSGILTQQFLGKILYPQTQAEQIANIVPTNFFIASHASGGFVLPERYGAVGNGNSADLVNASLDTAAINNAITISGATDCPVLLSRAYIAIPAIPQSGASSYNCAFTLENSVTFLGHNGGSIKIQDGYSTNAAPKEMAMFSTSVGVGRVSWIGLTMDMNGVNNPMSPSRPTTYNQFNHAAILVNGPNGIINTALIEDCKFQNTAGECFLLCALVAAGTTPILGINWIIKNSLFLNGGLDASDHTSIFAWCEDVICEGNLFSSDLPPFTVGLTGAKTAYEVHGSNQRFANNQILNYVTGVIVAGNFTHTTLNTIVMGNNFYVTDWGVLFFREQVGAMLEIDGSLISDNSFYFDNYSYSPRQQWPETGLGFRVAVGFQGQNSPFQLACNNVKICDNICNFSGTSVQSAFVRWDTAATVASNVCSNLSITDNQVIGANTGVYLLTNAVNGQGLTEISRNQFIDNTPDALANPSVGININPVGGISTLLIDSNQFVDERASPSFAIGILMGSGTITDFFLGQQTFKGLTGLSLNNSATFTNIRSSFVNSGSQASVTDGGTITHSSGFTGINPRSVNITPSVAGTVGTVTSISQPTCTVALKVSTTGAAAASQTVYFTANY